MGLHHERDTRIPLAASAQAVLARLAGEFEGSVSSQRSGELRNAYLADHRGGGCTVRERNTGKRMVTSVSKGETTDQGGILSFPRKVSEFRGCAGISPAHVTASKKR